MEKYIVIKVGGKIMFQIAICDDDAIFLQEFHKTLEGITEMLGMECNIKEWQEEKELKESLRKQPRVDLLFLDIELKDSLGVELGQYIREILGNYQLQIVYISHEQSYAMQLFETTPLDFLVKPITKERLESVLKRYIKKQEGTGKLFTCKTAQGMVMLPFASIMYFQSRGHKLIVHTMEGQQLFYGKLEEVEKFVPEYFVRIHKSFLVNEYFITSYRYDKVCLLDQQQLNISRSYINEIQKRIRKHVEDM